MFGILISHPVDSIKTHMQTHKNLNMFQFKLSNLYRGILSPLFGVGLEKSLVFGTYNYCRNNKLNIPISGAISGFIASLIVLFQVPSLSIQFSMSSARSLSLAIASRDSSSPTRSVAALAPAWEPSSSPRSARSTPTAS